MNLTEYEPLARASLQVRSLPEHLIHMSAGVMGEYGELVDAMKKTAVYGKPVDPIHLMEEVGDVSWYMVCYCHELEVHPLALQEAFDAGFTAGCKELHRIVTPFHTLGNLLVLSLSAHAAAYKLIDGNPRNAETPNILCTLANVLGVTCALLGVDYSEALERNIAKLAKRYKDNVFTKEAALNRDLAGERAALEGGIITIPSAATLAAAERDEYVPPHHPV